MSDFTVVQSKEEILNTIEQKLSEGFKASELSVLSKSKLHIDELHDSEVNLTSTSGTFSDKMAKLLTGEDGEEIVLSYYHISDEEKTRYKDAILDGKYVVVAKKDTSTHEEVEDYNAAYDPKPKPGVTHYAEETHGPKS